MSESNIAGTVELRLIDSEQTATVNVTVSSTDVDTAPDEWTPEDVAARKAVSKFSAAVTVTSVDLS